MKRFLVLALMLAAAWACGKKGRSAGARACDAENDHQSGRAIAAPNGIILTWDRPTEYVDGTGLKDLASFVIFRKEISQSCPDCPVPYRPLTTVNVEDRGKFAQKKQYRYDDQEVRTEGDLPLPDLVAAAGRFLERAVQRSRNSTG